MAKCIWKPNNNIILGLSIVQDLLVCMGMSEHICEGTHTCMYIWMETHICGGTETCVYLRMGTHVHEGIHECWGWRCTHMRAQMHVYIYGCVHISVRHTCLCIMVNMPVETHLILFFSSCRKSPWLGTQRLVWLASVPRVLKSLSLQYWEQSKFSLQCKIFKRIKLNNLIKF